MKLLLQFLFFFGAFFAINLPLQAQQQGTGDNTTDEEFSSVLKVATRATRDLADLPSSISLKKFAPPVQQQGEYATCVAWSSAYAARTISYAIRKNFTSQDSIEKYSFSPSYLYSKIKRPSDGECRIGTSIVTAMKLMKQEGVMPGLENTYKCASSNWPAETNQLAQQFKIKDFLALSDNSVINADDIIKAKKALTENKPLLLSMKCPASLNSNTSAEGIWTPLEEESQLTMQKHALCIIGYDDNKNGGSFEVMNSWGKGWGNKGFFWLSYPQLMKYGTYFIQMIDGEEGAASATEEKPQLSGKIEFVKMDETIMPVKRTKINTRSITVEDDKEAEYSQYKLVENYAGGTAFKIKFTTTAPAYVYIFSQDDKQEISRLFPYNSTISAAINSNNATIYIPSETKHLRLSNDPNKENICVLYSKNSINFEELLTYLSDKKLSLSEALKARFKDSLMPLNQVRFSNENISFKAPADDNKIVCFFIQLEHH